MGREEEEMRAYLEWVEVEKRARREQQRLRALRVLELEARSEEQKKAEEAARAQQELQAQLLGRWRADQEAERDDVWRALAMHREAITAARQRLRTAKQQQEASARELELDLERKVREI
jgi:hypothetical protein